jgi:hypothetical protein
MPRRTLLQKRTRNREMAAGIRAHLIPLAAVAPWLQRLPPLELLELIAEHDRALNASGAARAAWLMCAREEKELDNKLHGVLLEVKGGVISQFGDSAELNDFGVSYPKKRGPKTIRAKALGAEKGRATRAARHTMGKRQRAKIKGTPR